MRFYVRVNVPNAEGSEAMRSGKLGEIVGTFVQKWKPEACYFYLDGGKRGGSFFVNMDDVTQMSAMLEPFILGMNAEVSVTPAMNLDELKKGLSTLAK